MNPINIYLHRHGQSFGNLDLDVFGQEADTKLTELGRKQAEKLGMRYAKKGVKFDYILTSSYPRAQETAVICANAMGSKTKIEITDALVEYDPGQWRGERRSVILSDFQTMKEVGSKHMGFKYPGGESLGQVERRAASYLEERILYNPEVIAEAKERKLNFALFSHGQTIKCILHYIMGFDQSFLLNIRIGNTGLNQLRYDDTGWKLISINDQGHLL